MAVAAAGPAFAHNAPCSLLLVPVTGCGLRSCVPGRTAWLASVGPCKGLEIDGGARMLPPLAERRVLGPDAGVRACVPVQVTENRPLGTCTAYPGLLERGHGLRQGLVPPAFVPSFSLEFLISALMPGVSTAKEKGLGKLGWVLHAGHACGHVVWRIIFFSPCHLGSPPVPYFKDPSTLDTATSGSPNCLAGGRVNLVCDL